MLQINKAFRNTVRILFLCSLVSVIFVGIAFNTPEQTEYPVSAVSPVYEYLSSLGYAVILPEQERASVHFYEPLSEQQKRYLLFQEQQGFSSRDFINRELIRYTFTVTDYPGYENTDVIKLHLFFDGEKTVGGDLCCILPNGFITGIKNNGKTET